MRTRARSASVSTQFRISPKLSQVLQLCISGQRHFDNTYIAWSVKTSFHESSLWHPMPSEKYYNRLRLIFRVISFIFLCYISWASWFMLCILKRIKQRHQSNSMLNKIQIKHQIFLWDLVITTCDCLSIVNAFRCFQTKRFGVYTKQTDRFLWVSNRTFLIALFFVFCKFSSEGQGKHETIYDNLVVMWIKACFRTCLHFAYSWYLKLKLERYWTYARYSFICKIIHYILSKIHVRYIKYRNDSSCFLVKFTRLYLGGL